MGNLQKRLDHLEEQQAIQRHREFKRQFARRSEAEKLFFVAHGYLPEAAGRKLPPRQEFTVGGIKTVVMTEWAKRGSNE